MHVKIGDRVYYKDNGPDDTGTIIDILLDDAPFVVKWDNQHKSEYITKPNPMIDIVDRLGGDVSRCSPTITYNPADENIDQFQGSQLVLIESVRAAT